MTTPEQLISARSPAWQQLDQLVQRAERLTAALTDAEIVELGRLYRGATSDLALAQRDFPRHDVAAYLNQLVARAHATLYRENPYSTRQLRRFFTHVMPQTFRQSWRYVAVAALLFWLPALVAGVAALIEPATTRVSLSADYQPILNDIENHQPWFYFEGGEQAQASSFITTNNIRVSILAFAGGMTAGILSLFVLIQNGLMLGAVLGFAIHHDFFDLLNFVVGHGVIELSMICVAGGAGLLFAWAIVRPGYHSRAVALQQAGRKALILLVLCALFLVVAGLIEGFISPREMLDPAIKWAVGISSGVLMLAYLLLAGRERPA